MRYVVQIKKEKHTNRVHTNITIPHEWLMKMGLVGDKYERTADVVFDEDTNTITITKAAF